MILHTRVLNIQSGLLRFGNMIKARRSIHWIVLFAIGPSLCGCQPKEKLKLAVFPTTGQVFVDGSPAARAQVTLHAAQPLVDPSNKQLTPSAVVADDGSFSVTTYGLHDGAPAGDYAVTVVWPTFKTELGEETVGPDRLKGRGGSPLKPAAKVTIASGQNAIPPIRLTTH